MELQTQVEMFREENQMLKQQLAEQTELVQETRALKDRLDEQGQQQDALNHSVTMLREQQVQQQQEQARLGREKETLEKLKREVARETQALKTEQDHHAQAMQNLVEKTESLRKEFKAALDQSVTELRKQQTRQQQNTATKMNRLEREQGRMKREEEELKREMELNKQKVDRSFDALHQRTGIVPFQILMTDFAQHKRDNDQWCSEPFYSHPGGYEMCLRVEANGCDSGEGTYVAVIVCLMRGQYDNSLKWPFRGDVTIQLLKDGEHHTRILDFTDQTPDDAAGRVTHGGSRSGWGFPQFIPHTELYKYLKNDCLCFRVNQVDLK